MARKADEDLLAELDNLGVEDQLPPASKAKSTKKTTPTKAKEDEEDPLADFDEILKAKPATSRPSTPRLSSSTTSATNKSPKRAADYTPATTSQGSSERNSSEDRARVVQNQTQARASGEGSRSFHTAQTPEKTAEEEQKQASGGGGWWGSWGSIASAAVKQAESLAKNIQTNEEAQKWVTQIRQNANLENLQHLGMFSSTSLVWTALTQLKAPTCDPKVFPPSHPSSPTLLHQSPPTNAYKSTSLTTSSTILHSTH